MPLAEQQWCPTSVQVTVQQARGLRIKGKGGTNDAYAVMQVGKEKFQTSVVEKSVAPTWREEATFDLPPLVHQDGAGGGGGKERGTLHVHVLHRALVGPDKLLGQAVVNLLQLGEDKTREKTEWFKLLDKTGKADKDRGEVLLDIQFMRHNMTASMFDLSASGKSRSRMGKFKDKVRGKKKESDSASNLVPAFPQVLTESDEEGNGEVAAGKGEKKKKLKMKSLFSHKSNLQKNMSQSMTVLTAKNFSLSGSQSSGLNVDSSEGKKKFKFLMHKRSNSSDGKDSVQQKHGAAAEPSNVCINGSHVYCEEPPPRASRIGSNFSLASSGHGSMEDVPESAPPSVESLRGVRQYSPWTEEEEEELENIKEDADQLRREEEEKLQMEEMRRKEEEEEERVRRKEELERLAGEKRRREEEERRTEEENVKREEEESIRRAEEERRQQEEEEEEERVKREQEECDRLAEQKWRLQEQERLIEEERVRKQEEERILEERRKEEVARRQEEEREEKRRFEEQERIQKEEEERILEERRKEEVVRRQEEAREEKRRFEEQERIQKEEEKRIRMEEESAQEERRQEERVREQEEERKLAEQKRLEEEEERGKEEEMVRRQEEERKEKMRFEEQERSRKEEERIRMEEERIRMEERAQEERRQEEEARVRGQEEECKAAEQKRLEEEERRIKEAKLSEEVRIRREEEMAKEERKKREEEEMMKRQEEKLKEKRRLEEEERRQREHEEMIKNEEEQKARREKEEHQRLVEEKMKLEEEERMKAEEQKAKREKEEHERLVEEKRKLEEEDRKRIKAEEKIRCEEEERKRLEEERIRLEEGRRKEEERVRRQEKECAQLAEEKRILEEQERKIEKERKQMEEIRKREEEENHRKEKEENERLVVEKMRRQQQEEERKRIEEEEKIKREEEERVRKEEKAKRERKEEEARKKEKEKLTREAVEQKDNKSKPKAAGKRSVQKVERPAEVTSTNPFDEDVSNNPFEEIPDSPAGPGSSTAKVPTVQQRVQSAASSVGSKPISSDEKDTINTQRERRPAPQPPGRNPAERRSQREPDGATQQLAQINKKSKDKDIKTVSVLPQRSVQTIAPMNRSSTEKKNTQSLTQSCAAKETSNVVKHGKRTAPTRPRSVEEEPSSEHKTPLSSDDISRECGSEAKQVSIVCSLNPFEDDDVENAAREDSTTSGNTGSVKWPPAVSQAADKDAASQAKTKSSKAPAPPLPAKMAATSSTSIHQNTEGGHVAAGAGVTVNSVAQHACDPASEAVRPVRVQEASLQESQPAPAQRAGEDAGGMKVGPQVASRRRLQPVKPLNPLEQQSLSVVQGVKDVQVKTKVNDTGLKGPYSQLTQGELITLVLKQEKQLSEREKKISELEKYIDDLIVRVIEEKPSILMSLNSMKKAT